MTTKPLRHDLTVVSGDDFQGPTVRWLDSDRVPIAIDSARLTIRKSYGTAEPLLELDEASGLDLSVLGEVGISIPSIETEGLIPGVWDLEVTSAAGLVKTLLQGRVHIVRDVSHA